MQITTKPMSCPGRAEKYPPPLMRFLRSNVSNRSRGRSRSSPMFAPRKKSTAIETQEPTSPKVTCMGHVRVMRFKQPGKRDGTPKKRQWNWIKNRCFCPHFKGRLKLRSFQPAWCWWVLLFRGRFRRKSKIREDTSQKESKFGDKSESFVQESQRDEEPDEEEEEKAKVFVSSSSTPPKNALLLTRCRSAPYRSSSLASRFWGSPLAGEETEEENREEDNPTSGRKSICKDSDQQSRIDPETEEKLGPVKNKIRAENIQTEEVVTVRPLILTRCKSETARTSDRLDPETSF